MERNQKRYDTWAKREAKANSGKSIKIYVTTVFLEQEQTEIAFLNDSQKPGFCSSVLLFIFGSHPFFLSGSYQISAI